MNNTQKYINLGIYSSSLKGSMQKFNTVFWSKPPKQMGSFNVTLRNIETIIDNIKEIQQIREEMQKFTTLDFEAIKDNKSARKVATQIKSIEAELNQSYTRLRNQFFKQMDVAGKQCREVSRAIKDKDERTRFNEASRNFELMVYESKYNKERIPINKRNELTQSKQSSVKREHAEQERRIDTITKFELENANKLQSALNSLKTILAMTPNDDLSKEVRKEVAQIRKVLPPKKIAIAKDSLERLRHSSHLLLDLEQISEIMKTTHRFMGSDGKLQKINKQLKDLLSLLEQAIREERERKTNIKQEHDDIQSKVDYAVSAVRTYRDILDENVKLEQEQIKIKNNTHGLYDENERLKEDKKKSYEEAHSIEAKEERYKEWNDDLKLDQLYERAKKDSETIRDNLEYMQRKFKEGPVKQLPSEYTNMKKRLQSVSSLYQITQSQKFSTGGMSR